MSINKYALLSAKYEVMSEVVEYLEEKISEHEAEVDTTKRRLAERDNDTYKEYYIDRINEYAVKTEAYKTVQSMIIEAFD